MAATFNTPPSSDELVSNEVQDLISYRPHWLVRRGNGIFFIVLVLLLGLTWFIQYPDVIKGPVKLIAVNAPKLLAAKRDGKLEKLLVTNEQEVKQGQSLALLQSTANPQEVLGLLAMITRIEPYIIKDSLEILFTIHMTTFNNLGEIQVFYQDFQNELNKALRTLPENKKKKIPEQKYISDQQQKLRSSLYSLKSKLEQLVKYYLVIAPENGIVLFTSFLQENQSVAEGQGLFYLQPLQNIYYAQTLVSQKGLGKIKRGQRVLIRLESYPSNEFGYLTGTVNYISNIPTSKDSFLIKVDLLRGLQTNYNKPIAFRNNLRGQAEIIMDDRTLFDRFVDQLRDFGKR